MRYVKRSIGALLAALVICGALALTPVQAEAVGTVAYGAATVSCSLLNVRSGPGTDYPILATLGENSIVVVIEKSGGDWFYINYEGTCGYAKAEYFTDVLTAENFNATGTLTGSEVFLRESPSTSAAVIGSYGAGSNMTIIGINSGWYKVKYDGHVGYIRSDYVDITASYAPTRSARTASASTDAPRGSAPAPSSTGNEIADYALQFVGYRYVYGGASPSGFDCSGLTSYVYKQFGVTITRNASGQWRDNGVRVSRDEIAPGDLLFFSNNGGSVTHVGIYIGDDEFVHASGTRVGVVVSRLDSSYYTTGWVGAKRIAF